MARPELDSDLHELRGTKSQRKTPRESGIHQSKPKMPKSLSKYARIKWKETVRELTKRGTLTSVDAGTLEVYTELYAKWRLFVDDLNTRGAYLKDGELNPSAKLSTQMENALLRFQREFGATGLTKDKVKKAPPAPPKKAALIPGSCEALEAELETMQETEPETESESLPKLDELEDL